MGGGQTWSECSPVRRQSSRRFPSSAEEACRHFDENQKARSWSALWWEGRSVRAGLKAAEGNPSELNDRLQEMVPLLFAFCFLCVAEILFRFRGSNRVRWLYLPAWYRCWRGSGDMLGFFSLSFQRFKNALIAYLWISWLSEHMPLGRLTFKNLITL